MKRRVGAAAALLLLLGGCGAPAPSADPSPTPRPVPTTAPASRTPSPTPARTTSSPTTPMRTSPPTTRPPTHPPSTRPPTTSTGTLRSGSRGPAVTALQQRLAALHYDVVVTGTYGSGTAHAVTAFQKVNGLSRTGVADATTRARLLTASVPRARYARSGTALEVDLGRQVLFVVTGGTVARVYDVSTGRPSLPTPASGATPFHIWRKALSGSTGYGDTERWVSYYLPGTLLAIHGYSYVPPYPASHGCVRVPLDGAARLYAAIYVGEPLYTYH